MGVSSGNVQQERRGCPSRSHSPSLLFSSPVPWRCGEAVSEAPPGPSERVLRHMYPQPDHRAASEVDDGVDSDHFQVQLYVPGPFDGARHHQRGTDGARLLWTEPGTLVREDLTHLRGEGELDPRSPPEERRR